ncbi:MAG TPA: hypothetical protein VFH61_15445 [Thermoleophilia bacterium]|nr:hypothetical protein [Thermoleophilia bacterium]
MPSTDNADLRYFARSAARSQIRLVNLTNRNPPPPQALIDQEEALLSTRKRQLTLLVDSARVAGDLPPREDLLAEILLTEEDDCDNDAAEAGVAGAMLLAAMGDQEPSEAP